MALPGFLRVVDEVEEEEERPAADDHQFDDDEPAQYERDPQPSGRKQRKAYKKPESTLVLTRRVGNELAGCIQMGAALWEFSGDHCCAPILDAQSKELGRAIAEILRRYPTLLERIGESELISLMMQATLLTKAIQPVG